MPKRTIAAHPARIRNRPAAIAAAWAWLIVAPALLSAQDGEAVAVVSGRSITRTQLVDLLIESQGLNALQQLILLEAARAETQRRGLTVRPADVDAEFERSLEEIARNAGLTGDVATRENKLKALRTVLEQRRVSMAEYRVAMERNAHLRAIFQLDFRVDEATLREEFARTHGERVLVRHIQVSDVRKLNAIVERLRRGEDFAGLAREVSENRESAARGGELEPFTFTDENYPAAMREAAFALAPGQVSSPVLTGENYQVLRLERRIPPQGLRFEDVRAEVERRMRERVELEEMNRTMQRLFQAANVRVIEPLLRDRYEEFLRTSGAAGRADGSAAGAGAPRPANPGPANGGRRK